jgi:hypothetical protein
VFVVVQSIMTRSRGKDKVDPDQSIQVPGILFSFVLDTSSTVTAMWGHEPYESRRSYTYVPTYTILRPG